MHLVNRPENFYLITQYKVYLLVFPIRRLLIPPGVDIAALDDIKVLITITIISYRNDQIIDIM